MKQIILLLSLFFAVSVNAQKKIIVTGGGGGTPIDTTGQFVTAVEGLNDSTVVAWKGGTPELITLKGVQDLQSVTDRDSITTRKVTVRDFNISGVPEYDNNDSAIANGLIKGDVYRLPYDTVKKAYLLAITDLPPPEINFDITANWGVVDIIDEASFITYIENWGGTNISVSQFSLLDGRLRCRLECDDWVSFRPGEDVIYITEFRRFGVEGVLYIETNGSVLGDFNPEIPLPSTLLEFDFSNSSLTTFDPSIPLPSSLEFLGLQNNDLTSFNPSIPLPNSLKKLYLYNNSLTEFDPTIPLPNSLQQLRLHNNLLTEFNTTEPLPNSLLLVYLDENDLNSSSVNTVLALFNNVYVKGDGFILTLQNQQTPAPPTGDGIDWKNELIGRGASVTTD